MTDDTVPAASSDRSQERSARTYTVHPGSSRVGFRGKAFLVKWVHGNFPVESGTITVNDGRVSGAGILAAADVSTGISARDRHLRSSHYLHTHEHPTIAVDVHDAAIDSDTVVASVAVRGTTRPVELAVTDRVVDDQELRLTATGRMDRSGFPMLPRWCGVSRMIDIELNVVARRSN